MSEYTAADLATIEGGDHFVVIDVTSETWSRTLAILDTIAPTS